MTETRTYIMLSTAICLFWVDYRILPLFPVMNYGFDRVSESLMTFPEGAGTLWEEMSAVEQQALTGAGSRRLFAGLLDHSEKIGKSAVYGIC